jgi:hypothetical protein
MDKQEIGQQKKLKNRLIDSIRKTDIRLLIRIAKLLNIPIQQELSKKYDN